MRVEGIGFSKSGEEESVVAEAGCPSDWREWLLGFFGTAPVGAGFSQLGSHVSTALRTLSHWGTG